MTSEDVLVYLKIQCLIYSVHFVGVTAFFNFSKIDGRTLFVFSLSCANFDLIFCSMFASLGSKKLFLRSSTGKKTIMKIQRNFLHHILIHLSSLSSSVTSCSFTSFNHSTYFLNHILIASFRSPSFKALYFIELVMSFFNILKSW